MDFLESHLNGIELKKLKEIGGLGKDELCDFNVNIEIRPIELRFSEKRRREETKRIPAEMFPDISYSVEAGESYEKTVHVYTVPVTGDPRFIEDEVRKPPLRGKIRGGFIEFDIVDFDDGLRDFDDGLRDVETRYEEAKAHLENIRRRVNNRISELSASMVSKLKRAIEGRKRELDYSARAKEVLDE